MKDFLIQLIITLSILFLVGLFLYYIYQLIATLAMLGLQFDQTPDSYFLSWRWNF